MTTATRLRAVPPVVVGCLAMALLAACGGGSSSAAPTTSPARSSASSSASRSASSSASTSTSAAPSPAPTPTTGTLPPGWVDQPVSFVVQGTRVYATYRHPASTAPGPATLLIAGSGVPDRNGNSPGAPENSLMLLADQLTLDGVATLRYDKLGSGQTGFGAFADKLSSLRVSTYAAEAAAALRFLAGQKRSDPARLSVFGHSEGGLYALLLATGHAGSVPPIASLGLIEPASRRFFDVIQEQLGHQLEQAVEAGSLSSSEAATDRRQLATATTAVRAGHQPGTVPDFAEVFFGPTNLGYDVDIDRYDPADLAREVPAGTRVLLTCSPEDTQVPCTDVRHLDLGFAKARLAVDVAQIAGMDHALKSDSTPTDANDNAPLPMSPALARAIAGFVG